MEQIFTYIRPDGYIERITSENCYLDLNSVPNCKGDLPLETYEAEHIKRFSIWDEYDAFGNLSDARIEQRSIQCNVSRYWVTETLESIQRAIPSNRNVR